MTSVVRLENMILSSKVRKYDFSSKVRKYDFSSKVRKYDIFSEVINQLLRNIYLKIKVLHTETVLVV